MFHALYLCIKSRCSCMNTNRSNLTGVHMFPLDRISYNISNLHVNAPERLTLDTNKTLPLMKIQLRQTVKSTIGMRWKAKQQWILTPTLTPRVKLRLMAKTQTQVRHLLIPQKQSSFPPEPSSHPRKASNPSATQTVRCPRRRCQADPSIHAHPSSSSPTLFPTSSPRSPPPPPTPSPAYPTTRSSVRESPTFLTSYSTPSRPKNSTR